MPEETKLKPCHCGQQDYCVGQSRLMPDRICKIAAYGCPESDLERLAQEVAKRWPWKGAQLTRDELVATQLIASQSEDFEELCAAIHALAAYFAKG